jgi:glutathione S-transferase
VRIFLAEKGVKLPTVEVDMMKGENKGPEYLSKNPMETMPLLELDDIFPRPASFRNDAD